MDATGDAARRPLLHRVNIGVGPFEALLKSLPANLLGVVNHPIDLTKTPPPSGDGQNPWLPCQGGGSVVVSADDKGGFSPIPGLLPPSYALGTKTQGEHKQQQNRDVYLPSHTIDSLTTPSCQAVLTAVPLFMYRRLWSPDSRQALRYRLLKRHSTHRPYLFLDTVSCL